MSTTFIEVTIAAIVVAAIICFVSFLLEGVRAALVRRTSDRYEERLHVDEAYKQKFILYKNKYSYTCEVKTRKQVDKFDFRASLADNIRHNAPCDVNKMIANDERNKQIYEEYIERLNNLQPYQTQHDLERKDIKVSFKKYHKDEEELCSKPLLTCTRGLYIKVTVSYTSPAGRSHHERHKVFNIDEIRDLISDMQTEEYKKNAQKRERALMSNKLRYEILQRDGFKCVLCGASQADGAQLEVDHIVPVAKGGKTIPENLRTLCWNCNHGKLDSYSETKAN